MRTLSFICRSLLASLVACGSVVAATQENWPDAPQHIEFPTPYGTLEVGESAYIYEARLKLNGVLIDPPISGMLNISYGFSMADRQAALVAISQGNENCPVSYRWVILKADGYQVSPEFGSCSEQIRVSADAKFLTLQTPSREFPGQVDTYVYDGMAVKRLHAKK